MDLSFDAGHSNHPRGHALIYFRDSSGNQMFATYVLVLPIAMDMGKYLPPLLASQLGSMTTESINGSLTSFAVPPVPEEVPDFDTLKSLAFVREDDLVNGGTIDFSDPSISIRETAEVVQAYAMLYERYIESGPGNSGVALPGDSLETNVQHVLYELMSDRDKLTELSKQIGVLRFALERNDANLISDADGSIQALQSSLPEIYWIESARKFAHDLSERGATLATLCLERCYKLLEEEYSVVKDLERRMDQIISQNE